MSAASLYKTFSKTLNCNRSFSRQCRPFTAPCRHCASPRRSFSLQAAASSYNYREVVSTDSAPGAVGPYSQAIKTSNLVFCSGQVALVPGTKNLSAEDVEGQTEQVMKNLGAVLEAAGSSFSQVVKTTVLLTDMADFGAVNAIYGRYFAEEPPARACYAVKDLPLGAKVEIECMALLK